jgi:hypothetical protein
MKYDDISWHYNDEFPKELRRENAGTHIGIFIGWVIRRGLESDFLRNTMKDGIIKVKNKSISGTDFLINYMDGKFTDEDLNKEANEFTKAFYDTDKYFDLYDEILNLDLPSIFHVKDTKDNAEKIEKELDSAYRNFLANK